MTETPNVHQAWAAVMADVRALGKDQRYNGGQRGGSYSFRGIDDVMNAVGPVLRQHQVAVVPTSVEAKHRDVQTAGGKPTREATVLVSFTVYGPGGDSFTGMAPGESMDSGDKGTAKAMSVALRTFLLQSLCLPTDEPDPDSQVYQRDAGPTPQQLAQDTADKLGSCMELATLERVRAWADEQRLLDVPVTDPAGNGMPLGQLFANRLQQLQQQQAA